MKVVLKDVRLAFADIWEAKPFDKDSTPKFGVTSLFEPGSETDKAVQEALRKVANDKWGKDAEKILKGMKDNAQKCCYVSGDTKAQYDGFEGNMSLSAKSDTRPDVRDRDAKTPLIRDDGKPYAGCYAHVIVDLWAQDNQFGKGIRAKLLGIVFRADGDSFSGGTTATDEDFADLGDGADAPDLDDGEPLA